MRKPTQRAQLFLEKRRRAGKRERGREGELSFLNIKKTRKRKIKRRRERKGKRERNKNQNSHPTNAPHHATFLPAASLKAASSLRDAPKKARIVGRPRGVSASMANTGERVVPSKRFWKFFFFEKEGKFLSFFSRSRSRSKKMKTNQIKISPHLDVPRRGQVASPHVREKHAQGDQDGGDKGHGDDEQGEGAWLFIFG